MGNEHLLVFNLLKMVVEQLDLIMKGHDKLLFKVEHVQGDYGEFGLVCCAPSRVVSCHFVLSSQHAHNL